MQKTKCDILIEKSIGKKFNKLIIIAKDEKKKFVKVRCDCGKLKSVNIYKVLSDDTKSCGCIRFGARLIDLSGKRFGRLVVTRTFTRIKYNGTYTSFSDCICDCGKISTVASSSLKQGYSKSCGCLKAEKVTDGSLRATHRKSNHYLYRVWAKIKERCYNSSNIGYKTYGGRSKDPVKMLDNWKNSFSSFYSYIITNLGEKPSKEHSIDRIKNSKGYFPGNLRWATNKEQQRNKLNTVYLTYKGITLAMADWAERTGLPYDALRGRHGLRHLYPMTDAEILTKPIRRTSKHPTLTPNLDWLIEYNQPKN